MLGDLPEAQAIAKTDALVASGDPQSLEFVLRRFAEVLDDLHQAVQIGTRNYEQRDAQAAHDLPRIGEGMSLRTDVAALVLVALVVSCSAP